MTVWICGTSVSLSREGYTSQLGASLQRDGVLRNISVGDQTSICGLIRVLQHEEEFRPGDVMVWEYPLLDILLEDIFGAEDILQAMRIAWTRLRAWGVHVVVLKVTPRDDYARAGPMEQEIDRLLRHHAVPSIDTRRIAAGLGMATLANDYSDDRHPRPESRLVGEIAAEIAAFDKQNHGRKAAPLRVPCGTEWQWFAAGRLDAEQVVPVVRQNSLVRIEGVSLSPATSRLHLPPLARIVAVGAIGTHEAGSLWCGHKACEPASLRLTDDIGLPFLVRTTRLPCVRGRVTSLVSAPDYAFRRDAWADYGHKRVGEPHAAEVFGVLGELPAPATRPAEIRVSRFWRRGACSSA